MSVNSSSSDDDSLRQSNISSISDNKASGLECFLTSPSGLIFTTSSITYILFLLPLSIFILYLGLQRWRQQRATSTTTSHSDCFTYHMVAMELCGVSGYILCWCGIYKSRTQELLTGFYLWSLTWYGEMFFHILTCVDRYLAVVHPVFYLSLRGERGVRIRNFSIGCVWLLSFAGISVMTLEKVNSIMEFCILIFSLIIISFCSLSVLCVLIRPGPGEGGGDRERVDQSKQRAFYTIVAILGVLLLRFTWNLVYLVNEATGVVECVTTVSDYWFNLPSSLVLPLLFLHRAGKLVCRSNPK